MRAGRDFAPGRPDVVKCAPAPRPGRRPTAPPTRAIRDRPAPDDAGEHLAAPAGTTRRNSIG